MLLEENAKINDLGFGDGFLAMTAKAWAIKEKIEDWTSSKFKTLVLQKHYQENEKITHQIEKNYLYLPVYLPFLVLFRPLFWSRFPSSIIFFFCEGLP